MEEASVAGESPDRSKQRESSADPTSGSAGSVPEARDPRLAVSREKDSSGAVDTATKILSVRDGKASDASEKSGPRPPEEDQDSDLREAVSAWIRSAKNPETESGSDDTATASDASQAEAGTETEPSPAAATEAGTAPEAGVETEAGPETGEDATEDEARAPKGSDAKSGTDADSKSGTKSGADTETKSGAGTETKSGTGTGARAAAGPDAKSGKSGAEAGGETATGSDAETGTDAQADDDAGSNVDADPDPESATGAKAAEGAAAKSATGAGAGAASANADSGTEPGTDAGTDANTRAKTAASADTDTASANTDADTEPGTAADRDADQKADAGTDAKADANDSAKAVEGPDTAPTKAGAGTGAKAAAGADAKAAKVAGAKAAAAAARAAKAAAEAGGATSAPKDADGEDAPQGPPAADDESRTGGAGAKTSTAEGEAGAKGVDQPTTAFKAVRPKKPEVDQPTTMLKLGTAKPKPEPKAGTKAPAGPPAPEAERTSKFVPLRNSDLTAPTSAVPQVGPERTTQQPLPPKPPLDLLAELTNTPPPPETPVRTLVRRVKIWTPLVILLAIVFAVVQAMRPLPQPTLDLTAKDSYTFEGARTDIPWPAQGQAALDVQGIGTFGSSGTQKPVPIASVAKVMTAYLILRDHPLKSGADGPKIKIDQAAQDQSKAGQESTVDVTAGDSISQREALESILIASANNVARLLARWDVGSEKEFVAKMNSTAKGLGMSNTTYTDPSGLTNSTVSTAVDQVKLAKAAMEEPAFREVAAMMSYDDYKGVNHSNWNHLVGHNNVVGIKTGTTTSALGNLVFAAKQEVGGETRTVVGAVVRQPAGGSDNTILSGALDAADKLIRSAQGALKSATVLKKGDVVGYVDDGLGGRTPVVATKDVAAAGWSGLKVKLSFASDVVPHTAKAGTKVGSLTVGDGGAGAVKVPVALQKDLAEPGLTDKLTRLG
ncbi:D-alanyl-D-alanine carboxypeptidase [Streptomyces sp. NPDC047869]|uniref:D-alanyl-D-alanine carboxypeptidase n=1 Tax=Streptomyces sp. NPDC047869 TaxID=3154709 RepID=UPI0034518553